MRIRPFVSRSLPRCSLIALRAAESRPARGRCRPTRCRAATGTVFDTSRNAFSLPARNLREEHRPSFFVGNSFFNQNWVTAPASVAGRDGLGPLFNARSCSGCHFKDGRGRPPEPGEPMDTMLLRISVPGAGAHGAPKPDPVYGDQIQGQSDPRRAARGRRLRSATTRSPARLPTASRSRCAGPTYRIDDLGLRADRRRSCSSRRACRPAIIGLGLLEAIPERDAAARSPIRTTRDGDGISGRVERRVGPR